MHSPLTVAGAATVLAPDGSSSPCSLFSRSRVTWKQHHQRDISHDSSNQTTPDPDGFVFFLLRNVI